MTARKLNTQGRPRVFGAIVLTAIACALWIGMLGYRARSAPAREHAEKAAQLFESSDFARAESEWKLAVQLDPDMLEVWRILAKYYRGTRRPELAREALLNVRRLDPTLPGINGQLAEVSMELRDEPKALEFVEEELKRNPRDESMLKLGARLYDKTNELKHLEYRRRLVEIRPRDPGARLDLAESLTWKSLWPEALSNLEAVLKLEPENARALTLRAVCLMEARQTADSMKQAETDLLSAIRRDPGSPLVRFILGKLYRRKGLGTEAVSQLEKAVAGDPNTIPVWHELSLAYTLAGRPRDAAQARERFASMRRESDRLNALALRSAADPQNFELLKELGLAYLNRNDVNRARHFLTKARQLKPDDNQVSERLDALATAAPNQIRHVGAQ